MKILKYIRLLLFPISLLYGIVVKVRNYLFDIGKLSSRAYKIPIISVGNITVGGTGKTPLTEFIIDILKDDYRVALLSRGYKRKTQGVIVADDYSTAHDIGDEPYQIKQKFSEISVVVAERRVLGIEKILQEESVPEIVVMDDAYQHRYVKPGLSLLVMDFNRPLWKDCMLPAGELREPAKGKKRADIIVVSKCPKNLAENQQEHIIEKLNITPDQSVYFTSIAYHHPIALFCNRISLKVDEIKEYEVLLVSGIANPKQLVDYLRQKVAKLTLFRFSDHHIFDNKDVDRIRGSFDSIISNKKLIITTEKDAVRLQQVIDENDELASFIYYVPIQIEILNQQKEELRERIFNYVRENAARS